MANKRIFLISHQAELSDDSINLFHLAEGLLHGGHYAPVFIVSSKGPLIQKLEKAGIQTADLHGIKFWSLFWLIYKQRPILLHVNSSVNWQAALLGKFCDLPVVWHIREDLDGHTLLIRFIMKVSSQVIVISRQIRDYFPYSYWAHISVVYNAVNPKLLSSSLPLSIWQQLKSVFVKDTFASRKNIQIGFVGTIEPRKGVKELVEAINIIKKRVPQIRLNIVGRVLPVAKGYHRQIIRYAKKQKCDGLINWVGKVENIEEFMNNMDIIVVPSLAEPFGSIVIEGMAAGAIVIASRCGEIPEIITNGQTGFLVEPGNAAKLAEVMIGVMNLESMDRVGIIKRAKQLVSEKFLMPRQIDEIEHIYADVLNRHA